MSPAGDRFEIHAATLRFLMIVCEWIEFESFCLIVRSVARDFLRRRRKAQSQEAVVSSDFGVITSNVYSRANVPVRAYARCIAVGLDQ